MSRSRRGSLIRPARALAVPSLALGILLIVLSVADHVLPARADILGLSRVLAPYLALLFLPIGVLALLLRGLEGRRLGVVATVGITLVLLRFLPAMPDGAVAADPSLPQVRVATWNLYLDAVPAQALVAALADRAPGIIGLQELTPGVAEIIAEDPGLRVRFPYQVLDPADDWTGMGLLSSWSIEGEAETAPMPPLIAATIAPPDRPPLDVIVAHAPPPRVRLGPFGPSYDPSLRDATLRALNERLQLGADLGGRVVLLGDFNVTDREVGYAELAAGLTDSYLVAGTGLGHTWRPPLGDGLPFGMLRIDMVLAGPGATPVASMPDCAPRGSDHCILDVTLAIEPD